jgi:lipoate-protein ligase B
VGFEIFDIGLVSYASGLAFQQELFTRVQNADIGGAVVFCEHFPVITLGRSAKKENIKLKSHELHEKGIELIEAKRGGDVTYHGPGQLVVYPVVNLSHFAKDIASFMKGLEDAAVSMLECFGIGAERKAGARGVWVNGLKIASLGIAVKQWITLHGLALNVTRDVLRNFEYIRPCGMDIRMSSMETVLHRSVAMNEVKAAMRHALSDFLLREKMQEVMA